MASNEKSEPVTFGAVIERSSSPLKPQHDLHTKPSTDSTMSADSSDVAKKEWAADPSNPYSAFYKHPDARRSLDASSAQKQHLDVDARDLETGVPLSTATTQAQPKISVDGRVKECTMWPSRQAVMDSRKTARRKRGPHFFRNLTSKQRLWAKIVIALLVVAAAVGLGVGISRAVGGGVWAGQGKSNKEIGPHN